MCGRSTSTKTSFRVLFLYQTATNKDQKITLFKSTLEKIVKEELVFDNKDDLICSIIGKLPIELKGSITGSNTLYNIQN